MISHIQRFPFHFRFKDICILISYLSVFCDLNELQSILYIVCVMSFLIIIFLLLESITDADRLWKVITVAYGYVQHWEYH